MMACFFTVPPPQVKPGVRELERGDREDDAVCIRKLGSPRYRTVGRLV